MLHLKLKALPLVVALSFSFVFINSAFANCSNAGSYSNYIGHNNCQSGSYFRQGSRYRSSRINSALPRFANSGHYHRGNCPSFTRSNVRPNYHATGSNYSSRLNNSNIAVWPNYKQTINVFINSGRGVAGYNPSYLPVLVKAFHQWSNVSHGTINFRPVSNINQADIIVSWSSNLNANRHSNQVGKTLTVTSRHRNASVGNIEKAHIYLLTMKNGRSFSNSEIQKVALHEIGHALGIQGHSPNPQDIMHHTTSPYQSLNLTNNDINTLHYLYEPRLASRM